MDKSEIERRLESAEKQNLGLIDEINLLKEKLSEIENSGEIPEFPVFERGTPYYTMNGEFEIEHGSHSGYKGMNHEENDDLYNAFHTKEMAQEFADKCKLIAMMLHCKWYLCRDYKEDFEDAEYKWYVHYTNNTVRFATACFATDYCVDNDHGSVYFDTEENAQKCADWLNKHWKENEDE